MTWKVGSFFTKTAAPTPPEKAIPVSNPRFKVVVADFYDSTTSNGAINLAAVLNLCEGIEAVAYTQNFDHSFLNLESRNIFDLIDTGNSILSRNKADVIIWGYRDKDRIRLNFQAQYQYEDKGNSFISLMDCFYLPAEVLNDDSNKISTELILLLYGAVISTVNSPERDQQIYRKYLLKKISAQLSQVDSLQSLEDQYLPYILNMLGIIYLSLAYDSQHDNDFKIINDLFNTALQHQNQILHPTHLGCIYYHLGQLNDCAARYTLSSSTAYFRNAIKNYQMAQKYLSKYTYPYDYGYICYKLSELYINYWKQTEDLQALRDAVFQLRESEKIYTQTLFPKFWAHIQEELGYLLHNLAHLTKSTQIYNLAITAYQNQQKVDTEKENPLSWAAAQEKIGNIYYLQGRKELDSSLLEDALSCFHDALYIYETARLVPNIKQVQLDINKTRQILLEIKETEEVDDDEE